LRGLTGDKRYLFPGIRTAARPMSENTLNAALRRMGYTKDDMTSHGFRTMASSLLNESGKWNADAIERALAHKDKDAVREPIIAPSIGMNGCRWRNGGATIWTGW
jgi:integrase